MAYDPSQPISPWNIPDGPQQQPTPFAQSGLVNFMKGWGNSLVNGTPASASAAPAASLDGSFPATQQPVPPLVQAMRGAPVTTPNAPAQAPSDNVPLPTPRPDMAGPPMNLLPSQRNQGKQDDGPPSPYQFGGAPQQQQGQQQQQGGLIGRFVNALRGASPTTSAQAAPMGGPGSINYGSGFMPSGAQQQQPQGILPRMFNDFASLGKMFGGGGGGAGGGNPFNLTGSLY